MIATPPIVVAEGLEKHFPIRRGIIARTRGYVRAVDGVDLTVERGQTVGLVGESGSGKSTLGRMILRLIEPTKGKLVIDGKDVTRLSQRGMRPLRRKMQMVFQDPYASLDPLAQISDSIGEPLRTHLRMGGSQLTKRIDELLETVHLPSAYRTRYPRELSGGQLQRVAIARALAVRPELVVLDEPVSSLDVSIQAGIVNLLRDLQRDFNLTYVFIAHDLAVVRHMSHAIAVMYLGRIVEFGPAETVYRQPQHPYTSALLSAIPVPKPYHHNGRHRTVLVGEVPSAASVPQGCRFHTRCPKVMDVCRSVDPSATVTSDGTTVFCHLHSSTAARPGASSAAT